MNTGALERIFAERVVRRDGGRELPAGPKAQRTRGQILEAARALFDEQGYQRTSMAEVAARAGVSQGTVYQYFKHRSDLVAAIIHVGLRAMLDRTDTVWRPSEGRDGLERILTNYAVGYAEAPDLVRVWEEAAHVDDDLAQLRRSIGRLFESTIQRGVRAGQRAGRVARDLDPADTARALSAMTDRHCYVTYAFDPPPLGLPTPSETGRLLARLWAGALGLID